MSFIKQYQAYKQRPFGNFLFNKGIGLNAPFFGKLKPNVSHYTEGHCEVRMKDRWGVRNHIGTVNAGALCSLAELTGGLTIDSAIDPGLRWLPSGMTVAYIKKAKGTLTCKCKLNNTITETGDTMVPLAIVDSSGDTVFTAEISFYVSRRPAK